MNGIIVTIIVLLLVGIAAYLSVNVLKPNEMGLRVFLGSPSDKSINSGLRLTFPFLQTIERYTKNQLAFKFITKSVITKRALVDGYTDPIESAEVNVYCSLYCYFDPKQLRKTIASAPGSNAKSLGPVLVPYTQDIVREIGGKVPWRVLNQDREQIAKYVSSGLIFKGNRPKICKEEVVHNRKKITLIGFDGSDDLSYPGKKDEITEESPFHQFGLTRITFVIDNIDFTDEDLAKAVSAPEKARLKAIETRLNADAEQYKKEKEGKGEAVARQAMIKVIKENPDLEMLRALEEMAKGTSNTILYQIPAAFEKKISDIMGGNNIGTMLKMMKPEDLKALIDMVKANLPTT